MRNRNERLTYTIGEIPEFNEIKMQVLNRYRQQFIELNNEESEIRASYYYSEDYQERLDEFYERKNFVALSFIKDVNSGELPDQSLGIIYGDFDDSTSYYDKILIDLYHEYDPNRETSYEDCFVILPPVISQMEGGSDQLYEFIDKHIKETDDYCDEEGDYHFGGPFVWSNHKGVYCSEDLENLKGQVKGCLEKFLDLELFKDGDMSKVEEQLETARKNVERIITEDMVSYGKTHEETDFIENMFCANPTSMQNLYDAKDFFVELMETYGREWMERHTSILYHIDLNNLGLDEGITTIEEYLYKYIPNYHKEDLIIDIKLGDSLFERIMEKASNQKLGNYDVPLYMYIAKNPYLNRTQILEIKDRAQRLQLPKDYPHYKNLVLDILITLIKSHKLDETDIREMYNGNAVERKAIILGCSNIPEDIIQGMIKETKSYSSDEDKREGYDDLVSVIRNNQEMSVELIQQCIECFDFLRLGYNNQSEYIISQKNLPIEIMSDIARNKPFTVDGFLSREIKPIEVTEIFANSEEDYARRNIAESLSEGNCIVTEDTFRRLALDRKFPSKLRMKLLEMPEFKEILPNLEVEDNNLSCRCRDITYGGDGPGSFDNMGGERRFYINGKCILTEEGFKDSYATDQEGRKWARNAFTNFGNCTSLEKFQKYCKDHEEAIAVLTKNKELYESFGELSTRVQMVERALIISKDDKNIGLDVSDITNQNVQQESTTRTHDVEEVRETRLQHGQEGVKVLIGEIEEAIRAQEQQQEAEGQTQGE